MKKIILITLLLPLFISAQSSMYFGSVVVEDGTGVPVVDAKVRIEDRDLTTHTDNKGVFIFTENIPEGDYIISVTKEAYDTKMFLIQQRKNVKVKLEEVRLAVTKAEAKRRKLEQKEKEKVIKEQFKKLEKQKKKKEVFLKKQKQKLLANNTVDVQYDDVADANNSLEEAVVKTVTITETQSKYAKRLGVDPLLLTNTALYDFIDEWIGTPYLYGGETKDAIDCSSFTQRLFIKSYDMYLERTAQKQSDSKYTELFTDLSHLNEGDLLFFGKDQFNIVHVGVYLHNNLFVHATASNVDGSSGVKISDIKHSYWSERLMAAGRRKDY